MKQTITILLLTITIFAKSNDGDLDLSFGNQGKVITTINGKNFYMTNNNNSAVVQPDDKIVMVGSAVDLNAPFYSGFAVIRYNVDGSLDNSFGNNGLVIINIEQDYENATAVTLQSDGKIVVVGNSDTVQTNDATVNAGIGIARLNTNGSLDTSLSHSGKMLINFGFYNAYFANDVEIDNFNRIMVAGFFNNTIGQPIRSLLKFRLNNDGTWTSGFGQIMYDTKGPQSIYEYSETNTNINLYPDGKVLVVGHSSVELPSSGTKQTILLTKFKVDGAYDSTFGTNGIALNNFANIYEISDVYSSKLLRNGKILVGGQVYNNSNYYGYLCRFRDNGQVDSTFGTNGMIYTTEYEGVISFSVNNSSKITVCEDYQGSYKVSRFNDNGSKDNLFGTNGSSYTTIIDTSLQPICILEQSNGKVVVVGNWYKTFSSVGGLSLARYGSNGVGIEEQEENSFSLYPNPTKDFIKVEGVTKDKILNVTDIFGKRVFTHICKSENESIDISKLSAGMYFVGKQKFIKE